MMHRAAGRIFSPAVVLVGLCVLIRGLSAQTPDALLASAESLYAVGAVDSGQALALRVLAEAPRDALFSPRLERIARLEYQWGDPRIATDVLRSGARMLAVLGDTLQAARFHLEAGRIYYRLAELDSAIVMFNEGHALVQGFDRHLDGLLTVLRLRVNIELGATYPIAAEVVGLPDSARARGDTLLEARALMAKAAFLQQLQYAELMPRTLARADTLFRTLGDRSGMLEVQSLRAALLEQRGELDSAAAIARTLLNGSREERERFGVAQALYRLGAIARLRGEPDSARVYLRQALDVAHVVDNPRSERSAYLLLAELAWMARPVADLAAAAALLDSASQAHERMVVRAVLDGAQRSVRAGGAGLFNRWARVWLARAPEIGERPAMLAALAVAERSRSGAYVERPNPASSSADLPAEGARLAASAAGRKLTVLYFMATRDTLLTWFMRPGLPVKLILRALPADSLTVLAKRARIGLLGGVMGGGIATRDGNQLNQAELFRSGAAGAAAMATAPLALDSLARLVLPPELAAGTTGASLLIIPSGALLNLPFAALPLPGGEPLGQRYAVRYAPALSMLPLLEEHPVIARPARRAAGLAGSLVVGNPSPAPTRFWAIGEMRFSPLPAAEAEARAVAQLLGVTPLLGGAATETAVKERLAGAPIVHLATHGLSFDVRGYDALSFVMLAPGPDADTTMLMGADEGFLMESELEVMHRLRETPPLNADLVVLSACETGLGTVELGEGVIGMTRALLRNGARSVLSSLWSVSDAATSLLMQRFYLHWLRDRDAPDKAESLRRAQADVRSRPEYREPRYWAAFQLVGAN